MRSFRLDELCEIQSSGVWGEDADGSEECLKVIRASDIDPQGNILFDRLPRRKIPRKQWARYVCQDGDILVVKSSGSHTNVVTGKAAFFASGSEPIAFTNFLLRLRPKKEIICPDFVFFQLRDPSTLAKIRKMVATATYPNLRIPEFRALELRVPQLPEQRRIVSRIKACMERVEEIRRLRQTALREHDYLAQSLVEAELADLPGREVAMSDVCEIASRLVDPREPQYQSMLHVGGANIESRTGRLLDLKTAAEEGLKSGKFVFDSSVVLYNKIRPYLVKVARPDFSGLCSADMYPLTPKADLASRDFIYYVLMSRRFTAYAIAGSNRAGMPKLNREHLFAYRFNLPALETQRRICELLDSAMESVQELSREMSDAASELDQVRDSVLRKAFAGEL